MIAFYILLQTEYLTPPSEAICILPVEGGASLRFNELSCLVDHEKWHMSPYRNQQKNRSLHTLVYTFDFDFGVFFFLFNFNGYHVFEHKLLCCSSCASTENHHIWMFFFPARTILSHLMDSLNSDKLNELSKMMAE